MILSKNCTNLNDRFEDTQKEKLKGFFIKLQKNDVPIDEDKDPVVGFRTRLHAEDKIERSTP